MDITEANIQSVANKIGYNDSATAVTNLVNEGVEPGVAFLLVKAAEIYLANRDADAMVAHDAFNREIEEQDHIDDLHSDNDVQE